LERKERIHPVSAITPVDPSPMASPPLASPAVYRISVDEYERTAGLLGDDRVELIDGYLVRRIGKNPPHSWVTRELLDRLEQMLPPGWMWRLEQPVRIPEYDEPEPDIAIVRGTNDDYKHRTPEPADVALLVEVSETTYDRDRGEKWTAYSKSGIPAYWIINLAKGRVEVYTDPSPAGYQSRIDFQRGQQVPVTIGGQPLRPIVVAGILP
jgi:Uma2 family endonuclease